MDMDLSPAACMVRALRLLDPVLCEFGGDDLAEESWLAAALLGSADVDEERTARDIVRHVLSEDRDPLDGLFRLAEAMVDLKFGVPHCVDQGLWHQVGYEIDTDLLVAARLAAQLRVPNQASDWVRALSWPSVLAEDGFAVETVLSREIVDTHVHLGGALPGSFYWIAAMANWARLYRMHSWCPNDPERWSKCVRGARELRRDLFVQLKPGALPAASETFFPDPWTYRPEEPFCDYIVSWLVPDPSERLAHNPILGERWLIWNMLREALWAASFDVRDQAIEYLRLRNSFIRYLSHGVGHRGLERFKTTFQRQHLLFDDRVRGVQRKKSRRRRAHAQILALERFRVRHALRYQFSDPTDAPWARDQGAGIPETWVPFSPWRPARQVELRVTPVLGNGQLRVFRAYLEGVRDFVFRERDAHLVRVGFVFHVHRWADPDRARETARWQIQGLLSILDDMPDLRPFIVGIDAAGAEMATAPRELAEVYRMVMYHDRDSMVRPGKPPIRLGRTCHAGEDFRDLLTGLRYVDDAVALLSLRTGDRIGHGLAIALAPAEWYARRTRTYPLLGDHVLDLIWGRYLAQREDPKEKLQKDPELDYQLKIRLDAALQASTTRGRHGSSEDLEWLVRRYGNIYEFPKEKDLLAFLGVKEPGRPLSIVVDTSYIDIVNQLRARVLKRLTTSEVIIEACPTSNLLVGGFLSYQRLPYLNLNHLYLPGAPPDDPQVPLSINSDDPGVFRTTVANEYRLLGGALVRAGFSRRVVAQWLEEARRVGVESTFIPNWSPPTREELLYWLSKLGINNQ